MGMNCTGVKCGAIFAHKNAPGTIPYAADINTLRQGSGHDAAVAKIAADPAAVVAPTTPSVGISGPEKGL